jgi:hypothetical protein
VREGSLGNAGMSLNPFPAPTKRFFLPLQFFFFETSSAVCSLPKLSNLK